ncbi:MAG: tetratricopeptide repeat protein, partial [Candidatus Wildermuthbacteria bacterium]|nr:tetratricopeptide repeat protein [Candidatus Wildermuthbacteria bacterium]
FLITPPADLEQEEAPVRRGRYSPFFGALLIIVAIFGLYFGNIRPSQASKAIIQGIVPPLEKSIPAFEEAMRISPIAQFEAPEQFSNKVNNSAFDPKTNKEIIKNGLELAEKWLKENAAKSPMDFRAQLLLGRLYNTFYQFNGDKEKINLAESALKKAIQNSPRNQQGYWSLAQTKFFQSKSGEAIELLKRAVDLNPQYSQAHWYLVMGYKIAGQNELAIKEVKEAEKAGFDWRANLEDLKGVIEIYQNLQDSGSLAGLYPLAIEKDPNDARLLSGFAVAQANLKNYKEARELAQKALDLKPDFAPQIEEFLKSLPK